MLRATGRIVPKTIWLKMKGVDLSLQEREVTVTELKVSAQSHRITPTFSFGVILGDLKEPRLNYEE